MKLGGFVGYNLLHQEVSAFGCTQTATSTICVPDIATSVAVISQENDWHSLRVGLTGEVALGDRITVSAQGAWLPYVHLDGADSHLLESATPPAASPERFPKTETAGATSSKAWLESSVTNRFSVGVGGRYWHMQTSGDTHFEDHVVGVAASAQAVDWSVDTFGVLAQAKYRF